ncbi:MAG: LytTR family DNA-binding domain-containing protein [Ignavibacteria bacterium]|nr:LytTR family DNA-binding domain-containing protein [Ignavibacteria bacterium]
MKYNKYVLLVEDDESLRENIGLILEGEGFKVTKVVDGLTAVREIENTRFDIILCDIMMPGKDGYGVLESIKAMEMKFPPPFVFLTAKTERSDMRRGMELGADDFITKPFTRDELLNSIKIQLAKRDKINNKINAEKELLERIKNRLQNENALLRLSKTDEKSSQSLKYEENIFLSDNSKSDFIKISDILYLSAAKDYTKIYTNDGKSFCIRKPLKTWESKLPPEHFLRIHRSTIINTEYILKVERWFNYSHKIYLKDVSEAFVISQRYSRKFKKSITKM